VDLNTGKVSRVFLNNKIGEVPANFNKLLADRLGPAKLADYVKTAGAGSHSEIYAVNELLNGGAKIDNIVVYTEQVGGKFAGGVKPPCPHCNILLEGVTYAK
jgi:YwqJ-like deaminase